MSKITNDDITRSGTGCFIDVLPRGLPTLDISYKHFKALLKTYMFRQGHGALWAP